MANDTHEVLVDFASTARMLVERHPEKTKALRSAASIMETGCEMLVALKSIREREMVRRNKLKHSEAIFADLQLRLMDELIAKAEKVDG